MVLDGEGTLAEPDGSQVEIAAGSLILVPPLWLHRATIHPVLGMVELLTILRADWVQGFHQRFAPLMKHPPWSRGVVAGVTTLADDEVVWLKRWIDELMAPDCDALTFEAFLLDFYHHYRKRKVLAHDSPGLPAWLRSALIEMTAPKYLQGGTAKLAHIAGRSQHQINLLCRRHLGGTTTDVVNRLRMEYAARALRLTSDTIDDIAVRCGIKNRSYFSRLFTQTYGISPGKYRRQST